MILNREQIDNYWRSPDLTVADLRDTARAYHDLRDAVLGLADALTWKRPKHSPCGNDAQIEACCGREASCDAMNPSVRVVGAPDIREVVARVERGSDGPVS